MNLRRVLALSLIGSLILPSAHEAAAAVRNCLAPASFVQSPRPTASQFFRQLWRRPGGTRSALKVLVFPLSYTRPSGRLAEAFKMYPQLHVVFQNPEAFRTLGETLGVLNRLHHLRGETAAKKKRCLQDLLQRLELQPEQCVIFPQNAREAIDFETAGAPCFLRGAPGCWDLPKPGVAGIERFLKLMTSPQNALREIAFLKNIPEDEGVEEILNAYPKRFCENVNFQEAVVKMYLARRQLKEALEWGKVGNSTLSQNPQARALEVWTLIRTGNLTEASLQLREAFSRFKRTGEITLLCNLRNLLFQKVSKYAPTLLDRHARGALTSDGKRMLQEFLEWVVKRFPKTPAFRVDLIQFWQKEGNKAAALELIQKTYFLFPENFQVQKTYFEILLDQAEYQIEGEELRKASETLAAAKRVFTTLKINGCSGLSRVLLERKLAEAEKKIPRGGAQKPKGTTWPPPLRRVSPAIAIENAV